MTDQSTFFRGSEWRRWDPHIHAPGTALNDLFPSFEGDPTTEAWEQYLDRLEAATPTIEALGITDYYNTECYETVCDYRDLGRLQNVGLIFPNVELRYGVGTSKGTLDLSRFRAAPIAHLCSLCFEGQGAFPTEG